MSRSMLVAALGVMLACLLGSDARGSTQLRANGRIALVDTGAGEYFDGVAAGLVEALAAAGASAGEVECVILTHGHPDHVGGVMSALGPRLP